MTYKCERSEGGGVPAKRKKAYVPFEWLPILARKLL